VPKKEMLSFPQPHLNTLPLLAPMNSNVFEGQSVGGLFVKPTGEPRTNRRWNCAYNPKRQALMKRKVAGGCHQQYRNDRHIPNAGRCNNFHRQPNLVSQPPVLCPRDKHNREAENVGEWQAKKETHGATKYHPPAMSRMMKTAKPRNGPSNRKIRNRFMPPPVSGLVIQLGAVHFSEWLKARRLY
jgi:hypothetical protein